MRMQISLDCVGDGDAVVGTDEGAEDGVDAGADVAGGVVAVDWVAVGVDFTALDEAAEVAAGCAA
jgi:hypothetical protein